MSDVFDTCVGLISGAILMYWLYTLFGKKKKREVTEQQSTIILEKIRSVCKLVSVEGDFAEIFHYENTREGFMNLFTSKKKALIVIKAKAHIGYDLGKLDLSTDIEGKRVILKNFPQPEVLSIEPDIQFYDLKNGLFNSFTPTDLTKVNQEGKKLIREKIPDSGLMDTARKEALQAVLLVEKIVETIGWKLDYSALEISRKEKKLLEEENL